MKSKTSFSAIFNVGLVVNLIIPLALAPYVVYATMPEPEQGPLGLTIEMDPQQRKDLEQGLLNKGVVLKMSAGFEIPQTVNPNYVIVLTLTPVDGAITLPGKKSSLKSVVLKRSIKSLLANVKAQGGKALLDFSWTPHGVSGSGVEAEMIIENPNGKGKVTTGLGIGHSAWVVGIDETGKLLNQGSHEILQAQAQRIYKDPKYQLSLMRAPVEFKKIDLQKFRSHFKEQSPQTTLPETYKGGQ